MSKKKDTVKCTINKEYGRIGDKLIYANVSWNNGEGKDELRSIWTDKDGEEHLGKGVAITRDDIKELSKLADEAEFKETGVDFNKIFSESSNITNLRNRGYTTKDGFIVLKRKKK